MKSSRGSRAPFIAGVRGGRAPPSASVHGSAGRSSHGGAREGDEEGQDEEQKLTETRGARGRKEEADRGEEQDELTGTHCSSVGTARRRRKRTGPEVQREEDGEGELLGINGKARDGRSSDADDNSG